MLYICVMEVKNEEKEITREQVVLLSKDLKKLDKEWVHTIFKRMKKLDSSIKDVTKIHNIVNGSVKNQKYRSLFIVLGKAYYAELKKVQDKALELVEPQ